MARACPAIFSRRFETGRRLLSAVAVLLGTAGCCFLTVSPDRSQEDIPHAAGDCDRYYRLSPEDSFSCLRFYFPEKPSAKPMPAVVIFPGGAYGVLAMGREGEDFARFLNRHGIVGIVVKYPLGSIFGGYRRHPDMLNAARRSIRLIRCYASYLNIDPHRIGVMGASAGGHLAGLAAVLPTAGDPTAADPVERVSSRPDFVLLCYPVVSMTADCTHVRSRDNLLGSDPSPELLKEVSVEHRITPDSPPFFFWQTLEDRNVDPENSRLLEAALKRARVAHRAVYYARGAHGMGILTPAQAKEYPETAGWTGEMLAFLRDRQILPPETEGK